MLWGGRILSAFGVLICLSSIYAKLTHNIPAFPEPGMAQRVDEALNPKVLETAIWLDWGTMGQKSSEWRQRWEKEVNSGK